MKQYLIILFLWVCGLSGLFGQSKPIVIQTILAPPYPVYFSEVTELPGLATIIIQNTDMQNNYTLRFRVKLDGHNGISAMIPENVMPSNPLTLKAGEVKTLSATEFANIYAGIGVEQLVLKGLKQSDIIKSQRIPDGVYSICIQAFDNASSNALSEIEPSGCSNKMLILASEPPIIQFPLNDMEVEALNPQQVLIRWTPVVAGGMAILYDMRIVEVPQGITPYDAMRNDNLILYEEEDLPANVYSYGPANPVLVEGKTYAIQVTAKGSNGPANIRNQGKSDIIVFKYENSNKGGDPFSVFCGAPCNQPPIPTLQDLASDIQTGDIVKVGYFRVKTTQINRTGNGFSGTGYVIPTAFFLLPIQVEFTDVQINSRKELYNGVMHARRKAQLNDISCYTEDGYFEPTSEDDMEEIFNELMMNSTDLITSMNSPSYPTNGVKLPLSYGQGLHSMVISGMNFEAKRANMNVVGAYVLTGDYNEGTKKAIVGVEDVCITLMGPAGGNENTQAVLLHNLQYTPSPSYSVFFKKGNVNTGSGTYAQIGCDGIENFHLEGQVSIDRAYVLPENDQHEIVDGKRLAGNFSVETDDPNDWIAYVSFDGSSMFSNAEVTPHMTLPQMTDYHLTVHNVMLDNSATENPEGLRFPANYEGISSEFWAGLYAPNFNLLLPNYFQPDSGNPIDVRGTNFFFDDGGYSFTARGNNVLEEENPGSMGTWDFTISQFYARLLRSELVYGSFRGQIFMNITETPMDYRASMRYSKGKTRYSFFLNPAEELEMSMWNARMNLNSNATSLHVTMVDDDIRAKATLTGTIHLNDTIDDIPGMTFTGISFEDLEVSTYPPYLDNGTFGMLDEDDNRFAHFDISVDHVELRNVNRSRKALSFDVNLELGAEGAGLRGDTKLKLLAKRNSGSGNWSADGVDVDSIHVAGELIVVTVDGTLLWKPKDETYGNYFYGDMYATFFDEVGLKSHAYFGNIDNMDYWYVDAVALFDQTENLVGALGLKGFGGGAFYNMEPHGAYIPSNLVDPTNPPIYTPLRNGWGFKANVIVSNILQPTIFNGSALLEMDFEENRLIGTTLDGDFAMFRKINDDGTFGTDPMIRLKGIIDYDGASRNRTLQASLGYAINIPPGNFNMIYGERISNNPALNPVHLLTSDNGDWHIHAGTPNNRLNLNFGLRYKIWGKNRTLAEISTNSYFDIGSQLPAFPNLPRELDELNLSDIDHGPGSGAMMGTMTRFNVPNTHAFKIWGNGIYFRAGAGLGFDLGVRHVEGSLCNGNAEFGIDNWRAEGQAYMWAFGSLRGSIAGRSFNILSADVQSAIQAELPNPSFFQGGIRMHVGLPIYGGFTAKTSFHVGTPCEYSVDSSFMEDLALAKLIDDISWKREPVDDSVYAFDPTLKVYVDLAIPVGEVAEYEMGDGSILKTRVQYQVVLKKLIRNVHPQLVTQTLPRYSVLNRDSLRIRKTNERMHIQFQDLNDYYLLEPGSRYEIKFISTLMYAFDDDPYQPLKKANGRIATQFKTLRFYTKAPQVDIIEYATDAFPKLNQRYLYLGENTGNEVFHLTYNNPTLFDAYPNRKDVIVTWKDVSSHKEYVTSARKLSGQDKLVYSTPRDQQLHLAPMYGRIYKVTISVIYTERYGDDEKELFSYYFRTSAYRTYQDKINDLDITDKQSMYSNTDYQHQFRLSLSAKEGFGVDEQLDFDYVYARNFQSNSSEYMFQREINRLYCGNNSISLIGAPYEFRLYSANYNKKGELTEQEIEAAADDLNYSSNIPRRTVLELDWRLNLHAHAMHVYVQLHRMSQGMNYLEYLKSPRYGSFAIKVNDTKELSFTKIMNQYRKR